MPLVRVGVVVRALGLGGFVGVAGGEGALATLRRVALRAPGGAAEGGEERAVLEARPQGKLWAVRLEGVPDRTAAEGLVGCEVLAERADLPAAEGGHLWTDLEGLAVATVAGAALGRVTGLYPTGGVDVLVVTGGDGREVLVPLAPYVTVERERGRIVVDPPDGLLELAEERDGAAAGGARRGA